MSIKVDPNLCIGCGTCVAMCPDVFQMNSEAKAEAISQENTDCAKRAAEACPAQAIIVE